MNRITIIQALIDKYKYDSYLEIGVAAGTSLYGVRCNTKIGIDPDPSSAATMHIESDTFFENNPGICFDIIFIDGLHISEQVTKDIHNSLKALNPGGVIVMHDCCPTRKTMQESYWPKGENEWTGNVWKSFVQFRTESAYEAFVVNCDYGVGIIFPTGTPQDKLQLEHPLEYEHLEPHRESWLNLKTPEQFNEWILR